MPTQPSSIEQPGFKNKKNFIPKLIQDDRVITKQEEKQEVIFNYFNGILGTAAAQCGRT
jgi:hypothetical protein